MREEADDAVDPFEDYDDPECMAADFSSTLDDLKEVKKTSKQLIGSWDLYVRELKISPESGKTQAAWGRVRVNIEALRQLTK